jgi:hypothetical protein
LTKILPTPKYWRASAFRLESPDADAIADSDWIDYSNKKTTEFPEIPLEILLRADLDLILEGTPEKPTKVYPASVVVLLHGFPEHQITAQSK